MEARPIHGLVSSIRARVSRFWDVAYFGLSRSTTGFSATYHHRPALSLDINRRLMRARVDLALGHPHHRAFASPTGPREILGDHLVDGIRIGLAVKGLLVPGSTFRGLVDLVAERVASNQAQSQIP